MKNLLVLVACVVTIVLLAGIAALEWYAHVAGPRPPQPVAAVTAAPSATPASGPVVYVPAPAPTPAATAAPAPAGTATPGPSAVPASASPEPMQTLAPGATLPPVQSTRAPDMPPQILGMSLSSSVVHPGQVVSGSVETSTNVASVEARIAGYSANLSKVGAGRFALSYRVPNVPFFLRRTYTIEVIARNTRGDSVSSSLPITVQ